MKRPFCSNPWLHRVFCSQDVPRWQAPEPYSTICARLTDHHDPKVMNVIVGVETVDHPSDAQLIAHARKYLSATDRMQPQKP